MISEVIIDAKMLQGFKRRALKAYPKEYIEGCFGRIKGNSVFIYLLSDMEHEATKEEVAYASPADDFDDTKLTYLGTIHTHTHPDSLTEPSTLDWQSFDEDEDELIMGIMTIIKRGKRRQYAVTFWTVGKKQLEVRLSE